MNNKDKVQLQALIQVLIRLRADYRGLRETLAGHDDEARLRQWRERWKWEHWKQRRKDARN